MPIDVTIEDVPINVSASGIQVNATVGSGVGPQGPAGSNGSSGVITVTAPLVNSGTSSAAELSLSVGSGLDVADGALVLTTTGATAGDVLTFVDGEWIAAAPDGGVSSWDDLADKPSTFPPESHAHAWSDITSGVPSTFAPSAHKTSHATGGSDALSAADIGAAAASHTHAWSAITSGLPTTLSGYGITDAVASNDARLTDARTPTSHTHGNLSNDGLVNGNTTSGQIVVTTTGGALTTSATIASSAVSGLGGAATLNVGTTAGTVAAGDHTHSPSAITFAATDRLLGRATASGGAGEEITCTAAGRAILDDADAAAQRTTLSAQKTITSGTAAPTGGSDGDIYLQYSA